MKAYLAGAIEHAPDKGKAWRDDISRFLEESLGHEYYNPLIEERKYLTDDESLAFRGLKYNNISEYKKIVRKLITGDIRAIDNDIQYIICLWDQYAENGGGTYGELTLAFRNNIPVYMVTPKVLSEISGWILGCTSEIFNNFKDLKCFLNEKFKK